MHIRFKCLPSLLSGALTGLAILSVAALAHGQVLGVTSGPPLPTGRAQHATVTGADGAIYFFGGFEASQYAVVATSLKYDPQTSIMTPIAPMPIQTRGSCGALAPDGRIYLFGGWDDAHINATQVYDPLTDSWSFGVSRSTGWCCRAATGPNGLIHVTGGDVNPTAYQVYDPVLASWTDGPAMTRGRLAHGAVFVSGTLYVFGGMGQSSWQTQNALASMDAMDPNFGVWMAMPNLPSPHLQHGYATEGSNIFVLGGSNSPINGTYPWFSTIDVYDVALQSWASSSFALTQGIREAGSALVAGQIHLLGGTGSAGLSAAHDIIQVAGVCGNGMVESPEDCDDGGVSATCDGDCTFAVCGDGQLNPQAGEDCDDGGPTASCDVDCTLPACGDGLLNTQAGESCDEGGETATCNGDCTPASCGDGVLNQAAGEDCDDAGESATCDVDCSLAICGDAHINPTSGEVCDDGGESVACDDDCTPAECGDLVINNTAGETCDEGGATPTCDADCTLRSCGDGVHNAAAGEICDDGEATATCDADCTEVVCGDGVANAAAGEECDDAGLTATCDADCTFPACGDGLLNILAGEECDDGNLEDGDGCDARCDVAPLGSGGAGGAGGGMDESPSVEPLVTSSGCTCRVGEDLGSREDGRGLLALLAVVVAGVSRRRQA